MGFPIQDMQRTRLTARGRSAAGNPTTDLQGPLAWESSDPNIVAISEADGLQATATALGPLGTVMVRATGQNANNEPIQGEIEIDVVPGPTVAIQIDAAPPEAQ